MKKVIITLIVAPIKTLLAGMLLLESPQNFVEIDPLKVKQPAKRIFIGAKPETKKQTISYHRQLIQQPYEEFLAESKVFLESTFPVAVSKLGSAMTLSKLPIDLFFIKGIKKDFELEILQAYIPVANEVFLISLSVPKASLHNSLDHFKTFLSSIDYLSSPFDKLDAIQSKALTEIQSLIKENQVPIETFFNHEKIQSIVKNSYLIHEKEKLSGKLLELRAFFYD